MGQKMGEKGMASTHIHVHAYGHTEACAQTVSEIGRMSQRRTRDRASKRKAVVIGASINQTL